MAASCAFAAKLVNHEMNWSDPTIAATLVRMKFSAAWAKGAARRSRSPGMRFAAIPWRSITEVIWSVMYVVSAVETRSSSNDDPTASEKRSLLSAVLVDQTTTVEMVSRSAATKMTERFAILRTRSGFFDIVPPEQDDLHDRAEQADQHRSHQRGEETIDVESIDPPVGDQQHQRVHH